MPWLLNRLYTHQELPVAQFAFQGTVNWMRALAILIDVQFTHASLKRFYSSVARRHPAEESDTLAFGYLLMALHNTSALHKASELSEPYPLVRSAIISWYYSVYYSSKAMIAAATGSDPQTHSLTSKLFQVELVDRNLICAPFNVSVSNLSPSNIKTALSTLRGSNRFDLNTIPTDREQAYGAVLSYLKGTADYQRTLIEEEVTASTPFKALGVANFRSKAAKSIRDTALAKAKVNFLVQAFRYRGKANYRDAIYMSYGTDRTSSLVRFTEDLAVVANAFSLMATHYVSRRVIQQNWEDFSTDLISNARFPLPFDLSLT